MFVAPTPQPEAGQATPCLSALKIHGLPFTSFNSHRRCRFLSDQARGVNRSEITRPAFTIATGRSHSNIQCGAHPLSIKWIHNRGLCTPDLLPQRIIILHSLPIRMKSTAASPILVTEPSMSLSSAAIRC
jgi:hypothetical protein